MYNIINYNFCMKIKINILNIIIIISTQTRFWNFTKELIMYYSKDLFDSNNFITIYTHNITYSPLYYTITYIYLWFILFILQHNNKYKYIIIKITFPSPAILNIINLNILI